MMASSSSRVGLFFSINVVNEHDGRSVPSSAGKELAHILLAAAHPHGHEVGSRCYEKRSVALAGQRPREHGLASPGVPVEKDSAGRP